MYRKEDREKLRLIEAKLSGFERSLQNAMKGLTEVLAKGQENQAEYLRRIENLMQGNLGRALESRKQAWDEITKLALRRPAKRKHK
jgi:hypothetical protein